MAKSDYNIQKRLKESAAFFSFIVFVDAGTAFIIGKNIIGIGFLGNSFLLLFVAIYLHHSTPKEKMKTCYFIIGVLGTFIILAQTIWFSSVHVF